MTSRGRNRAGLVIAGVLATAALAACSSGGGNDSADRAPPPPIAAEAVPSGVLDWELVRGEATVKSIDAAARKVVLVNAKGDTLTLKVGPNVDFARIRPGDQVAMAYYEAVALDVSQPGSATPGVSNAAALLPAQRGQVPAGAVVEQTTVTSTVAAIDPVARTIAFTGPDGNVRTVKVKDPQLWQHLSGLQVGDVVQVSWIEGVAMQLVPKTA